MLKYSQKIANTNRITAVRGKSSLVRSMDMVSACRFLPYDTKNCCRITQQKPISTRLLLFYTLNKRCFVIVTPVI